MVSDNLLHRLSALIDQQTGLHFPETRFADLERTLTLMAKENRFASADACLEWLLADPDDQQRIELLIKYLTVGETYFLRDRPVFDCLKNSILPERVAACRERAEQRLTIWSAACASGEEPYSIAITVDQLPKGWQQRIDILATDINHEQLHKARSGSYSQWSFRSAPDWLRSLYFTSAAANQFSLHQRIIDMVSFSHLNLSRLDYPPPFAKEAAFDVIFCRNVLMYFAPPRQQQIISTLSQRLAPGGWLIVSPCEAGIVHQESLRPERMADFLFFRKIEPQSAEGATPLPAAPAAPPFTPCPSDHPAHPTPSTAPRATTCTQRGPGPPRAGHRPRSTARPPAPPPQPLPDRELFHQAREHYQGKRYELAEGLLNRIIKRELDAATDSALLGKALSLLAQINCDQGHLERAEELCQQAILADKLNPDPYFNVAMICQELGDSDRAVYNMRKVIYLDPDFVMAHFHLGSLVKEMDARRRHLAIACELLAKVDKEAHLPFADEMIAGRILELAKAMLHHAG